MSFQLHVLTEQRNKTKLEELMRIELCDNCLGRQFAKIGHGMSNAERGEEIRKCFGKASGKKLTEPRECSLCGNFFSKKINEVAAEILKGFKKVEFRTFLVGSVTSGELVRKQDEIWQKTGIEDVEPAKAEINRELGKIIEKKTDKEFSSENPDLTILYNMQSGKVKFNIRSLFVAGGYSKLARGIPQTMWVCSSCGGKGCVACKGTGKLYPTSVQEIIEKPMLKAAKARKSSFHGAGREDIDARNLGYRPFIIEIEQPKKRKLDLKKMERLVNKNRKVKVRGLRFVGKDLVEKLKKAKIDKTYEAEVFFEKDVDRKSLGLLKRLATTEIRQQTPQRVVHRRADIMRKRAVRSISWKVAGKRRIVFRIRAESGLYIKELISGDEGRTEPNISELIGNKVKKINLDVIRIHTKS